MKKALLSSIATLALGASAFAADLPARGPAIAPAPVFVATGWTGFYLGAGAGGVWSNNRWNTTLLAGGAPGNFDNPANFDQSKGRISLFAGYNWQINQNWVAGVEADLGYAFGKNNRHYGVPGTANGAYAAGSTDLLWQTLTGTAAPACAWAI